MIVRRMPGGRRISIVLSESDRRLSTMAITSAVVMITVMVAVIDLSEERHGMDGTGRPVQTSAECQHKSATVFIAERTIEDEITGGVDRHQAVEYVAQRPENGLLVRLRFRFVEDFVDERGGRRQLAHQEHDHDGNQRDGDADLVGRRPLLSIAADDRLALRHHLAQFLTLAHRVNQERIEDDEQS